MGNRIFSGSITISLISWLLTACSVQRSAPSATEAEPSYCSPAVAYQPDSVFRPVADVQAVLGSPLTQRVDQRTLLMANAAGILPQWLRLEQYRQASAKVDSSRNAYLQLRQQLLARLLVVSTEVSSVVAELSCEQQRTQQRIDELNGSETRKVRRATVASIVVGALTAVVSTLLQGNNESGAQSVAIGGGLLGAGFGLQTLLIHVKTTFYTPRNLLTEVWERPVVSQTYPPSVWYILNEKLLTNSQRLSVLEHLHQQWASQQHSLPTAEQTRLQQLYFGKGGSYQIDELRSRVAMLNRVQVAVLLIDQDLQGLLVELSH